MKSFNLIKEIRKTLGPVEVALHTLLRNKINPKDHIVTKKILTKKHGSLRDKVVFISGGSRGIGLSIAKKFAQDGAKIVIAAKTTKPHPKLPGTIYTAADEIKACGGEALPLAVDIRDEAQVKEAVEKAVSMFGGIDILINNASAIELASTENTSVKKFDLMFDINVRGTFLLAKYAVEHLKKAKNPHILTLSPPINLKPEWFTTFGAYTASKYAMSMMVKTFSEEFKFYKVASNALWPRTVIATSAVLNMKGGKLLKSKSRSPEIMADAAYEIVTRETDDFSGNFFIDDEVLTLSGVKEFEKYSLSPGSLLQEDLFL